MTLEPDHSLLLAYAQTQAALERIEERRRLSPVRQPWRIRCLIAERQAMAQMDGGAFDDLDMEISAKGRVSPSTFDLSFARDSIGASIRLDALTHDAPALLVWLGRDHERSPHDCPCLLYTSPSPRD